MRPVVITTSSSSSSTGSGTGPALAEDTGSIKVNDGVATVLWGDPMPKFTTQGTWATIPLRVYAPTVGMLTLTVAGPVGDALADGDVKVYGVTATDMDDMPLDLIAGKLVGTWPAGSGSATSPGTPASPPARRWATTRSVSAWRVATRRTRR